jgi:hypothetical protein
MAFGILLIALVAGMALFFKAKKYDSAFGKFLGILIILFAVLHLVCTSYYGMSYWKKGYFEMPMAAKMQQKIINPAPAPAAQH